MFERKLVLAPQRLMPVPAEIRGSPALFMELNMEHHRAELEVRLESQAE